MGKIIHLTIIMSLLKKIKTFLTKPNTKSDAGEIGSTVSNAPLSQKLPLEPHQYPITLRIMDWLTSHGWKYEHRPYEGDDSVRVHHIVLGFADHEHEWTCIFRINEINRLVTIFGALDEPVPSSHFAPLIMAMMGANRNISFGNIELDMSDGEVRAKVGFDAEFTSLSDHALSCHMQAVASLVELCRGLVQAVLADDAPSQLLTDYLPIDDSGSEQFYLPTHLAQ